VTLLCSAAAAAANDVTNECASNHSESVTGCWFITYVNFVTHQGTLPGSWSGDAEAKCTSDFVMLTPTVVVILIN